MVVLRAPNELLTMDTKFAAAPDVGWPDCFNSGMMVLNPNLSDYYSLLALAHRGISFDGADQGLLNMHFTEWEKLSFTYNCTPNANYQYVPAYKYFQNSIKILHFIGAEKPWTQGRYYKSNSGVYNELLGRWWAVYDAHYRRPQPVATSQFIPPRRNVQDYVRGEETRYESQPQAQPQPEERPRRLSNSGYSITEPRPQPPPGIHYNAQQADSGAQERPFGDQPSLEERIEQENYQPTRTIEQRRWSAPHSEWEPARYVMDPQVIHYTDRIDNHLPKTRNQKLKTSLLRPTRCPKVDNCLNLQRATQSLRKTCGMRCPRRSHNRQPLRG